MKIQKSTLDFLTTLKENNNREWFNEHKNAFKKEQTLAKDFYNAIMDNLNKHDVIDKFKLFRIYRDVRFSKDKTPYQPHFAGSFSRSGKELRGGYYLRIRPGESFLAGGFWAPNKEDLFRIRKEFEFDDAEIRKILAEKKFNSVFGGKLVGEELKTAPRGFDKDFPDIGLLNFKSYTVVKALSDKEITNAGFLDNVLSIFKTQKVFNEYLNGVINPPDPL